MSKYYLNYLDEFESEAIYVLREVWAQFQNLVILFSGGKDSILVTHLAKKAFYPSKIPFPLMHVDTLEKIADEVSGKRQTERGNRSDDKRSESAMEDRKSQGYF